MPNKEQAEQAQMMKMYRGHVLSEQPQPDEMMKLYREHVLGEKPQNDVVPITSIAPAPKPVEKQEPVGSFGD